MPRLRSHKRSLACKLRRQKQLILTGRTRRKCFVQLGLNLPEKPPQRRRVKTTSVKQTYTDDTDFAIFQIPIEDENLDEIQEDTQLTVQSLLVHLEQTSEESPSEPKESHIFKMQQEPLEETIEEVPNLEEIQEDTQLTVQSLLVHLEQTSESPSEPKESHIFKMQQEPLEETIEEVQNLEEPQEETQLTVQSLVPLEQTSEESPSEPKESHIFKMQQEPLEETIEEVQNLEEPQEETQLTVQSLVPLEQTSEESPSEPKESHIFKVPELTFFPEDLDLFHETTT